MSAGVEGSGTRPFALGRTAVALARCEGDRLARHPAVLVAIALSVLVSLPYAEAVQAGGRYLLLTGATLLPLALATLVAANLAALRSRQAGTWELHASAPAAARARTLGLLLSLAWPTAIAALMVAAAAVAFEAWQGLRVDSAGRTAVPSAAELLQGPLAVALMGALGIAMARWIPHPAAVLVLAVVAFAVQMPAAMWGSQEPYAWFLPLVNPADTPPGSSWPCSVDAGPPCVLAGLATGSMAWHAVYAVAIAVLLAVLALLGGGRRRGDGWAAAVALAAAAGAGVLQVS